MAEFRASPHEMPFPIDVPLGNVPYTYAFLNTGSTGVAASPSESSLIPDRLFVQR